MCRAKSEGSRRCSCDSSESRRLRRINGKARKEYAGLLVQPMPDNFLPLQEDTSWTVEQVKENLEVLKQTTFAVSIAEESEFRRYAVTIDKTLHTIGDGINYIAETEYGSPSDQQFHEESEKMKIRFTEYKNAALLEGKDEEEAAEDADIKITEDMMGAAGEPLRAMLAQRNEALRNALTAVGVVFADPESLKFHPRSDEQAVRSMKEAIVYFPQSWVQKSNEHPRSLLLKAATDRPYYTDEAPRRFGLKPKHAELRIDSSPHPLAENSVTMQSALHEFSHRIEYSLNGISAYEKIFLGRRAGLLPSEDEENPPIAEEPSPIYPEDDSPAGLEEIGYKDNFPDHYMGKVYNGETACEIMSTGMEALFGGEYGALSGIFGYPPDPDYKRFILGMLASSVLVD